MRQTKFSCKEDEVEFLRNYKEYGFKDKSAMVRESLNLLREKAGIAETEGISGIIC